MPLAARKIKVVNDSTTMTEELVDHVHYIAPKDMKPGDVEVEPVSVAQLAELAANYPEEYGEKARAAGIEPSGPAGRLAELLAMNAKKLVAAIADLSPDDDVELLWALYEAEVEPGEEGDGNGRKRQTVLDALALKGIKEE